MHRTASSLTIAEISKAFYDIEFPEYQREPDVWNREQKQRLIDSILREFDISSIYFYRKEDDSLECIDGRQRLNAIMSFLGRNVAANEANGFPLRFHNEIASSPPNLYEPIDGLRFAELDHLAVSEDDYAPVAAQALRALMDYPVIAVYLSGSRAPEEFNLQFLRLNLGTLVNAGEKLHAMIGSMRDVVFDSPRIGKHPFLDIIGIPTRRYAREQVAAQIVLQVFTQSESNEFARARHFDLQRFLKTHADVDPHDPLLEETAQALDALQAAIPDADNLLKNRAIVVSVVVLAWSLRLFVDSTKLASFVEFIRQFVGRLRWQVENMKSFSVDGRYPYLVEFQRHVTQASVERPALERRHQLLRREFELWQNEGELTGDAEYRADVGGDPPCR